MNDEEEKSSSDQKYSNRIQNTPDEQEKDKILNKYKSERIEKMEHMLITNPSIIGYILKNKPEYAEVICQVVQNISEENRNRMMIEAISYTVVGAGLATASILTMGGVLPVTAMLIAAGVGVGFSTADYVFQVSEIQRHKDLHKQMLDAYLSGGGNEQSIDDMREAWTEVLQVDYASKVTLGLGIADLLVVPGAARAGAFLRISHKTSTFNNRIMEGKKLLRSIVANNSSVKTIRDLLNTYPKEDVGHFLSFVSTLNPTQQKQMINQLNTLSKNKNLSADDLVDFAQSKNITSILSTNQQRGFIEIVEQFTAIASPKIKSPRIKKILSNKVYNSLLKKIPLSRQSVLINAILVLTLQGKSQSEIIRGVSNLLPIPDSLPSIEEESSSL